MIQQIFKHSFVIKDPFKGESRTIETEHEYEIKNNTLYARNKNPSFKELEWYPVKKNQIFLVHLKDKERETIAIKLEGYLYFFGTTDLEELKWVAEKTGSKITDNEPCEGRCVQCGACCLKYNIGLKDEDIKKWQREGRYDILAKTDFEDPDVGWLGKDGDYAIRCPWLRKNHKTNKYTCRIHDTKPRVCRDFPPSLGHLQYVKCQGYNWRKYLPEEEN